MSEKIPADALIDAIGEPETVVAPPERIDEPEIPDALPVPPRLGEILELVDELIIGVEGARNVPLSSSVMMDRSQLLAMLYRLRDELPDELRQARWMVREREQFVARTNEKAREMLDRARERSDELIAESYIVKEAVEEANHLIRHAESEATRIRLEAEDTSEKTIESTEELLADLLGELRRQRAELHQSRRAGPSEA
jgi:hypothetical protein